MTTGRHPRLGAREPCHAGEHAAHLRHARGAPLADVLVEGGESGEPMTMINDVHVSWCHQQLSLTLVHANPEELQVRP